LHDHDLFLDPSANPTLNRLIAEAKITGEPETIAQAMTTITEQASGNMKYHRQFQELYSQLSGIDAALAQRTGQHVLATFRGLYGGRGYVFIQSLSEALIRSGNVMEIAHAYQQITANTVDPVLKLAQLNRIRHAIDGIYSDLPERPDTAPGNADIQDPLIQAIARIMRTME
jgi:hypothetical protein